MPRFDYIAVNEAGQRTFGQADGADSEAVGNELRRAGLNVLFVHLAAAPSGNLSDIEGTAVAQQLVAATQMGLPLTGVLRAFSEEVSSRRFNRRLIPLCEALERGESLDSVLLNPTLRLPPAVSMILKSGLPPATINALLMHSIESLAARRELNARAVLLITFPSAIILMMLGMWIFMLAYITPLYNDVLQSFGVATRSTPLYAELVKFVDFMTRLNTWQLVEICVVLLALTLIGLRLLPSIIRGRLWSAIPLIGSMYRLLALSDLAYLLGALLERQVPLPKALKWAAEGSRDVVLADWCHKVALRIEAGDRIEEICTSRLEMPAYGPQILRWAAQGTEGGEPLMGLSRMLRFRSRMLSESALPLVEPILLMVAVVFVICYSTSLLIPLFTLLRQSIF